MISSLLFFLLLLLSARFSRPISDGVRIRATALSITAETDISGSSGASERDREHSGVRKHSATDGGYKARLSKITAADDDRSYSH